MERTSRKQRVLSIADRLTSELAVTTDPDQVLKITAQLAKLLPKPRRRRKRVEPVQQAGRPIKRPRPDGSAMSDLPDQDWLISMAVLEIEKARKLHPRYDEWLALSNVQKGQLDWSFPKMLTEAERVALDAETTSTVAAIAARYGISTE
jgi:hypothetical protein